MQRCPNYNICRGFYIFSWLCTSRRSLSGRSAILTIHWGFSSVKVQDLDCCVFPLFSVVPQFNANNAPLWTVFFFFKLYENICGLYYYLLTSLIQNKILLFPLKTATLHDRITQSHHHQGNNEILIGIHCTFLLLKCRCPKPQSQYAETADVIQSLDPPCAPRQPGIRVSLLCCRILRNIRDLIRHDAHHSTPTRHIKYRIEAYSITLSSFFYSVQPNTSPKHSFTVCRQIFPR